MVATSSATAAEAEAITAAVEPSSSSSKSPRDAAQELRQQAGVLKSSAANMSGNITAEADMRETARQQLRANAALLAAAAANLELMAQMLESLDQAQGFAA